MSATVQSEPVQVSLFNDRSKSVSAIKVTSELARLFGYAHKWSTEQSANDPTTLRFSSMLAAMAAGPDLLCEWFRGHLALRGVSPQVVTAGRAFEDEPLPANPLVTTHSFRQALEEANRLAGERPLDIRHFMAAYPVVSEYHRDDFLRFRIDRRAWCLELSEVLKERFPDEVDEWSKYAERAPAVLLPPFDADLPAGADLLGIGREVEAFAMLIAGKETMTPLSIGVFGAWGSGKSYFMARVEERVAALAAHGGAYYRRIAQVRFNAWHYAESNVITSIVDHVFRNLRFGPDDEEKLLLERQQQALAELGAAEQMRVQQERALAEAETKEAALRAELDRVTHEIDEAIRGRQQDLARTSAALSEVQARFTEIRGGAGESD